MRARRNVAVLFLTLPFLASAAPARLPAQDTLVLARKALNVTTGAFDGCAASGTPSPNGSQYQQLLVLNQKKNRSAEPGDADLDSSVTLAALLAHSRDDSRRWNDAKAGEVVGYVLHVKPGGKTETTNCRVGDPVHRDTHIELTVSETDTMENRRVIVEVTPRWRAAEKDAGTDWSTQTLQQTIEGHWVRVRGWLLFDAEHRRQAENTNNGGDKNWRATSWEIHPISRLETVQQP